MSADLGRDEQEIYRVAVEASPSPTLVADANGIIALANREAERLFGWAPGTMAGHPIEALLPDDIRTPHIANRERFAADPVGRPMGQQRDLRAQRRDGTVFPVEVGLNPVTTSRGRYVICAVVDLTERKLAEQRLAEQASMLEQANRKLTELATTDSLTSLWNRRAFLEQLDIRLEQSVRSARPMSVLILDVDHFKPYNDQYGHLAGDEVLRAAARLLRRRARRSDFLGRIGGEEFGVILDEADRVGAVRVAEHLRQAVEVAQWPRRSITVSIGAATVQFPNAVPRPESPPRSQLLSLADQALYYSKEHGRNRVTHVADVSAPH
ncbi:MAG: diguanylate cyclase [Gemmatimonadota bacterium]|nr:diguanylate cyclase [Gemmatimonadota bacterium]MDH5198696.1 diguanylate cyclase [Gemmatimonadota bacterium]